MNNIEVVAFDCDGVLFDTAQANRMYYSQILQHFGRPGLTEAQFRFVHMHTIHESMAYLFPDEKILKAAYVYRQTMDYQQYLRYLKVEPQLVSVLEKLRPLLKTAIATNRTDTIDQLLAQFDLGAYFDLVVTASDVKRPKPHPEALLKISRHFRLKPHQVLYIGDSAVDEQAARSAGMPLVAYRNRELAAEFHIDGLGELEKLLNL